MAWVTLEVNRFTSKPRRVLTPIARPGSSVTMTHGANRILAGFLLTDRVQPGDDADRRDDHPDAERTALPGACVCAMCLRAQPRIFTTPPRPASARYHVIAPSKFSPLFGVKIGKLPAAPWAPIRSPVVR